MFFLQKNLKKIICDKKFVETLENNLEDNLEDHTMKTQIELLNQRVENSQLKFLSHDEQKEHIISLFKKASKKLLEKEHVYIEARKEHLINMLNDVYNIEIDEKKLKYLANITDPNRTFFLKDIKPLIDEYNNNKELDPEINEKIKAMLNTQKIFKEDPNKEVIIEVLNAYFKFLGNPGVSQDLKKKLSAKKRGNMNNLYMRNTASHKLNKYKNNLLKAVNSRTKRMRKNSIVPLNKKRSKKSTSASKKRKPQPRAVPLKKKGNNSMSRSRSRSSTRPRSISK